MRSRYADPSFWVEACDRAVKVWAAAMVGGAGTNALDITDINWAQNFTLGAISALVSILTSVATAPSSTKHKHLR